MPANPIAVSLGDPAGIGPECVTKAWLAKKSGDGPVFFAIGSRRSIEAVWLGPVKTITDPAEATSVFPHALPLFPITDDAPVAPGAPTLEGARVAYDSLEAAIGVTREGAASALVTGPIAKNLMYSIGFRQPGQTEFVAERCGIAAQNAVMMLAGPGLRVVPITTHVPLIKVPELLTRDLVIDKAVATARGLERNFGVSEPRLALAGLNPHAGENGNIGREEVDILAPAVQTLQEMGINIVGPLAADSLFTARSRTRFDAILCPTHDQALIPLKALYFDEGVNITLGLPLVRTSPDHGTAFDIAGKNIANPGAMIAAIRMAGEAARHRVEMSAAA